jgi:hypothetical protein
MRLLKSKSIEQSCWEAGKCPSCQYYNLHDGCCGRGEQVCPFLKTNECAQCKRLTSLLAGEHALRDALLHERKIIKAKNRKQSHNWSLLKTQLKNNQRIVKESTLQQMKEIELSYSGELIPVEEVQGMMEELECGKDCTKQRRRRWVDYG